MHCRLKTKAQTTLQTARRARAITIATATSVTISTTTATATATATATPTAARFAVACPDGLHTPLRHTLLRNVNTMQHHTLHTTLHNANSETTTVMGSTRHL